jgi:prevent-host-death family protein
MRHVPLAEFKDKLSEYVAAVEAGEEVIVTRHGKAAVRVSPIGRATEERRQQALEALERMAQTRERYRGAGFHASPDDWIEWKNEGRR